MTTTTTPRRLGTGETLRFNTACRALLHQYMQEGDVPRNPVDVLDELASKLGALLDDETQVMLERCRDLAEEWGCAS